MKLEQKGNTVLVLQSPVKGFKNLLKDHLFSWQLDLLKGNGTQSHHFQTEKGPLDIILLEGANKKEAKNHRGLLQQSLYTQSRDIVGQVLTKRDQTKKATTIYFENLEEEALKGALVGLEMGAYDYVDSFKLPNLSLIYRGEKLTKAEVKDAYKDAQLLGEGVNLARELVNTPSGFKTPGAYSKAIVKLFKNIPNVKVNVWNEARLKKEKMGLILGVGGGASEKPCLVHIQYRPKKVAKGKGLKWPHCFCR